jgi:SAM-dependent methyltransferase
LDRVTRLLGTASRSLQILEIGPSYSPIAPKSGGWRTHVVDHSPRNKLQTKYANAGVDVDLIEEVDTVWQDGPLHDAVPPALLGRVDLIIASHVLEHIPNLIGFLRSASQLLTPGGRLSVALPDRRYCFDCFRPWTTTGELLEAYHRDRHRHSLGTAFDHLAYSAATDGQIAWGPRPVKAPDLLDPFAAAVDTVASYSDEADQPYKDYHAWQFAPAGFRLIILELAALGLSDWLVKKLDGPENFEFFAILGRGASEDTATLQVQRQRLLLDQLAETREQINFMLGASDTQAKGVPVAGYEELMAQLKYQDARLQEMSETLAWVRAVLTPVRTIWRSIRGKR